MFKKIDTKALFEGAKLVARLLVLSLPVVIDLVLQLGFTELASTLSAVLVFVDKVIHEAKKIKLNGLIPF